MLLKAFIQAIREELLGFSFGNPWRYDKEAITCILPLIRKARRKRKYITLAEAQKVVILDTGKIGSLEITNNEDVPVFLRVGELLRGKTQSRTMTMSQLVMPGEKVMPEVTCVHASHPISSMATFSHGCLSPGKDLYYIKSRHSGEDVSQSESWKMDRGYSMEVKGSLSNLGDKFKEGELGMAYNSSFAVASGESDNLEKVRDTYNKVVKDILKNVPLFDNQIGMALIDARGFHSLECFDLHGSWKATKEAIVGKESVAIAEIGKDGVFEYHPKKAKGVVRDALKKGYEEKSQHKEKGTETITMDFQDYVGEAVLLDDRVIHLLITRKES